LPATRAGCAAPRAALRVVVAVAYVASGVLGWTRRPHNRVGPLLAAAGLAWMVWALRGADAPFLTAVGLLCEPLPFAITLHLLLAFPSGRLEGRAEVAVAAAAYVSIPLVHAPAELVGASRHDGIRVLDVVDDASLADVALTVQTAVDAVLLAAAAVLVLRRLRAPDPRRTAAPVYLCGLVALAVVALLDVLDGSGLTVSGGLPGDVLDAVGIAIVALLPLGFVAGILRGNFARAGELEGLVDRLANAPRGPAALAAAVSDALGDPSATLAYWLPAEGRYVDASGAALEPGPGRAVEEVTHEGRRVGAIAYDGLLLRDPGPVRSAAMVVGLALERERLAAELRASARELRASRARLAEVADEERRRLDRRAGAHARVRRQRVGGVAQQYHGAVAPVLHRVGVRDPGPHDLARIARRHHTGNDVGQRLRSPYQLVGLDVGLVRPQDPAEESARPSLGHRADPGAPAAMTRSPVAVPPSASRTGADASSCSTPTTSEAKR
jgi:hypothetical protein